MFVSLLLSNYGLGLIGLKAQNIYLKQSNNTQTIYALNSVEKMTFSSGVVTVHKTDNNTGIYALSGLRYLNFTDLTTSIVEQTIPLNNDYLIAYPNPVTNILNIDLANVATEVTISILTLEGKVIQEQKIKDKNTVSLDFSELPQGIYLCYYTSNTEIKKVKIIKQ